MQPKKLRNIFALKKELQLTEDELYLHLQLICKTDSIKSLSDFETDKFIRSLRSKLPKKPPFAKGDKGGLRKYKTIRTSANPNVITLATPEQRELLTDLIGKINASTKYKMSLEGMAQRQFKKSEKLLTRNEARILTEAAKSILTRST